MDAYPTFRSDTRWDSVSVIAAIGTPLATAALLQLLDDPDAAVRTNAAGWLVSVKDPVAIAGAVPVLLTQLNTDTIRQLGHAGDHRAVAPLIAALEALPLDTKTYPQRMALAGALGRLGDSRAIPILERLVQTDTVELDAWGMGMTMSVAEAAQMALAEIAARTAGRRPTPDAAGPPADDGA